MRLNTCRSMIDILRDRAAELSDSTAFTFLENGEQEGATLAWSALDLRSRAIAATISTRIDPGARVLILLPPGIDFVPAFFGVLYAGAIALPAYPPSGARNDRSSERLRGMIDDANVTLVLSSATVHARVAALDGVVPGIAALPWIDIETVENEMAEAWRIPPVHGDTIALLQYTSGSTSAPRGVMVSHRNLVENLSLGQALGAYQRDSVAVSWLPVNHDMGLINGVLQPVFSGYAAYLMSPAAFLQRPFRWLQAVSRYGATHSGGPNFAYDLCSRRITEEERASLDLSTWRVAYNGSEPVRPHTLDAFYRAFSVCGFQRTALRPAYGLAESTLLVTTTDAEGAFCMQASDGRLLVSSGSICNHIRIVDPATRVTLQEGTVGEIWVSGPSVARGYWNKPRETAASFSAYASDTNEGPFLRTGDLGLFQDGRLFVTGRIKDVLIVRGVKHYPQDIEVTAEHANAALRPGCCAAFGVERNGEERIVVVAEAEQRRLADEKGIRDALISIRASVAERHQVSLCAVALVAPGSLPKTTSGKLQRFLCRSAFLSGEFDVLGAWSEDAAPAFIPDVRAAS
jgi:acyl-CoA synthetase (AMP-forming)/AMP-acid ligase II